MLDSLFDNPLYDDTNALDGSFFLDGLFEDESDETSEMITPRALKREAKIKTLRKAQLQTLRDIAPEPPVKGESYHIVSACKLEFYTWIPYVLDWLGQSNDFYCATWTISFTSVKDFFREYDAGRIRGTAAFLLGTYFKRREPVVYAKLAEELKKRDGWFKCFETHCKVMLFSNPSVDAYITVEGSANLTANPRLENMIIVNDKELWEFHKNWMLEMKSLRKKMPWD